MNYYERHIGDYLKDTAHLSLLEHGVYARLMDVYYTREGAIPEADAARLVAARSREERAALAAVLDEFFDLRDGAWHQSRCDREIRLYSEGEPEREVKKANTDNRLKRHREERSRLFKIITDAGQHADWNIKMDALREIAERISATAPATVAETATETLPATQPATAPATPATASHTPYPDTIPNTNTSEAKASGGKPPTMTPEEIIFGYGVPLLVSAGNTDKAARSFLGGLRKAQQDDGAIVNALRDCIRAKPLQPLEWLAAALPPKHVGGKQTALERRNAAVAAELGALNA